MDVYSVNRSVVTIHRRMHDGWYGRNDIGRMHDGWTRFGRDGRMHNGRVDDPMMDVRNDRYWGMIIAMTDHSATHEPATSLGRGNLEGQEGRENQYECSCLSHTCILQPFLFLSNSTGPK